MSKSLNTLHYDKMVNKRPTNNLLLKAESHKSLAAPHKFHFSYQPPSQGNLKGSESQPSVACKSIKGLLGEHIQDYGPRNNWGANTVN